MFSSVVRRRAGFTLLEVTISMALLGLITLGVFSIAAYGNRAFSQGNAQNATQSDVRLVNDYILQQVRFATSITLHTTTPAIDVADESDYIYFDGGRIVHSQYNNGDPRIVTHWGSGVQNGSSFWTDRQGNSQLFGLKILGLHGGRQFNIESSIELPNIALKPNHTYSQVSSAVALSFRNDYVVDVSGTPGTPGAGTGFQVNLIAQPSDGGQVHGGGYYGDGTTAIVSAVARDGYSFLKWSERVVGQEDEEIEFAGAMYFFTVTGDITLVAEFEPIGGSGNPYVDFTVSISDFSGQANPAYRLVLEGPEPSDVTVLKQSNFTHTFVSLSTNGTDKLHRLTIYRRDKNNDPWGTALLTDFEPDVVWVPGGATLYLRYQGGELTVD